eukprot:CAMPEP_0184871534 /NCGR_PEP_ID=MMETSP0580-20130426/40773_1 /TAXON_ID=1118495 /ORGANISM="Dactyliosolen fragilissimus" /LENGTH=401 /DNA_ID=CAMNT_0027374203 /DNA_START=581 /DNA_END=1787 /DNA_ORIENTATION=+
MTTEVEEMKSLEEKKNSEIQTLKSEIENIKSGGTTPSTAMTTEVEVIPGSVEELSAKLLSYQNFMSNYIVKAQEDKARAVKEAEQAIVKKYEEKLNAFLLAEPASETTAGLATTVSSSNSKLYDARNAKVTASAQAGKSRWGDAEISRVKTGTVEEGISVDDVVVEIPPEVIEADHGLRADGGVDGPTLAQRVALGAQSETSSGSSIPSAIVVEVEPKANGVVVPSSLSSATSTHNPNFDKRNQKIAAASKAGKQSRWGSMEESKAVEMSELISSSLPSSASSTQAMDVPVPPEVIEADHGLRADGGVGGLTLAQRVALGANSGNTNQNIIVPTNKNVSVYIKRNEKIAAAAKSGKQSRWGGMEEKRVLDMISNNVLPSSGGGEAKTGKGRVNVGASILNK